VNPPADRTVAPLAVPQGIPARIRRFLRRRAALAAAADAALAAAIAGGLALAAVAADALLLLPPALRIAAGALIVAPVALPAAAFVRRLLRRGPGAADLRRLDNRTDDLRAALDLVPRAQAGDPTLRPELVRESAQRAGVFETLPLPPLAAETRRLRRNVSLAVAALAGLAAWRVLTPDLHTGVNRLVHPLTDFGSVGPRKFAVSAEVWANAAAPGPDVEGAAASATPIRRAETFFLRSRLEGGRWVPNGPPPRRALADWLAGWNPLAMERRSVELLDGDRLDLRFSAVDRRRALAIEGVEFRRFAAGRELPLRYQTIGATGVLSVARVTQDHAFELRTGRQFSPRYRVHVVPRPTPTRILVRQHPPAQYGRTVREVLVRDAARGIQQSRLGGLPGTRLDVEFETPYADDLDLRASYVQLGDGRRLVPRRLTSRAAGAAPGAQTWQFDFVVDESFAAGRKLYFRLVTARARFAGQPIANDYDEPLLVQALEDAPPTVEFTALPQQKHFASDEAFAFRYRYTDDYGITEVGLEYRDNPNYPQFNYAPLGVRPAAVPGDVRREDEVTHILDLNRYPNGFVDFALVVKDVKGQVVKTGLVSLTMSDSPTEVLLPKLSGGWTWLRDTGGGGLVPMKVTADLDVVPAGRALFGFADGLDFLAAFPADGTNYPSWRAADLLYRHSAYLGSGALPFGFHHRDYPDYFHRQASAWLTGLAELDGASRFAALYAQASALAGPEPARAAARTAVADARPIGAALRDRVRLLTDVRDEIVRRVALQRAAHFSGTIVRRMAATERQMAVLRQAAGPMPPELQTGDPWEDYPEWVSRTTKDPELERQALLARFNVRNTNRKMAALHTELERLLADRSATLDPRLRALMGMVARGGATVTGADRADLAVKAQWLERFIRQGVLAAEDGVYRELAAAYPRCAAQAAAAQAETGTAAGFPAAFAELSRRAAALAAAELPRHTGEPRFPAGRSARWIGNRTSRLRTALDGLGSALTRVLRGPDCAACTDLVAVRADVLGLRGALAEALAESGDWPALAARHPDFRAADAAASNLLAAVEAAAAVQRAAGGLAGFGPVFAVEGLPETADRPLAAALADALAGLRDGETFAADARAALAPALMAGAALAQAPWAAVACTGPEGERRDVTAGAVRVARAGDFLALQGRLDGGPAGLAATDWRQTGVELYFSPAGSTNIRQFILRPMAAGGAADVELYERGEPLGRPVLDHHVRARSDGRPGCEWFALVPLALAGLDPQSGEFRFECAYRSGPDGTQPAPRFVTLFGSGLGSPFIQNARYGTVTLAVDQAQLRAAPGAAPGPADGNGLNGLLTESLGEWWRTPLPAPAWSNAAALAVRLGTDTAAWAPNRAGAARLQRLNQRLAEAARGFGTLAAAVPAPAGPAPRVPAQRPLPGISAASSRLFDEQEPAAVLGRLEAELRAAGNDAARADALGESAAHYFANFAVDAVKDAGANPVAEYLRARAGAALYLCSTSAIVPFARTFTRTGNERKDWLRTYFRGRDCPAEVETFIRDTDYGVPTLPPALAALAKPWLEAGDGLPALLRAQRAQRVAELAALARATQGLARHQEALVRVHELGAALAELTESLGLLRYPPDDIRLANLWDEVAEQAEGLERDCLAGRLPDIPADARQALRQRVHVFREPCPAGAADAARRQVLREYASAAREIERRLLPRAHEAARALEADRANLRRDVALVLLTLWSNQYWFERQLEVESLQKRILYGGMTEEQRYRTRFPDGSFELSRRLREGAALAAYGWRAACTVAATDYAADPTEARRDRLLHELAWLSVFRLLPEFFDLEFERASYNLPTLNRVTPDALPGQMIKQLGVARRTEQFLIAALTAPGTPRGLPSTDEGVLDLVMPFEATPVLTRNEQDVAEYEKAFAEIVRSDNLAAVRQGAARLRALRSAQGQYWRLYGAPLGEALDHGRPLAESAAAEAAGAVTNAAARLAAQRDALRAAERYMADLGAGLGEREQAEMTAVADAAAYAERWLAALPAGARGEAGDLAAGYPEVYGALLSFVQSQQGNWFPAEGTYPPRPPWRRNNWSLSENDMGAEMLTTERSWFARADHARARVYRALCEHAAARLAGGRPDATAVAFAFQRYVDTRYRHMQPFGSPEGSGGRPPLRPQIVDTSMPEHLAPAFNNAQTIDLPAQDNRLIRKLYFESIQEDKDATRDQE
jgi:hypothetical protein